MVVILSEISKFEDLIGYEILEALMGDKINTMVDNQRQLPFTQYCFFFNADSCLETLFIINFVI